MIKVALVGYGYWGKNLLRNLLQNPLCKVECVYEINTETCKQINTLYPDVITETDYNCVLNNNNIDAVIIATPTHTHYDLAKKALLHDKHVLIEKPFTTSVENVLELIDLSQSKNKILMVDHTFLYSGAVEKIQELIKSQDIGELKYFDSTRINLGLIQSDINVLWDLAPHDLSILSYIQKETPVSVTATGISHLNNGIENIAYMTINYNSDFIAHLNCSWYSPVKVRTTLIGGDKKMIVYDDINPTEKIRVYDSGFNIKNDYDEIKNNKDIDAKQKYERLKINIDYRMGDIYVPKLKTHEPLYKMLCDFFNCISNNSTPISNWKIGLDTVKILEAAQKSIKQNSKQITI
jgi:predicted dehydrogenase